LNDGGGRGALLVMTVAKDLNEILKNINIKAINLKQQ